MSIDPNVRPAHIVDISVVLDLDVQHRSVLLNQRGGIAWLAEHVPLITLPPQDVVKSSFVGEIDGAVVGFLRGTIDLIPERGKVYTVDRVFVVEQARQLGFGDALLAAAIERAMSNNCLVIEANALPGDRETKNLYERAGITARSIIVSRSLGTTIY